MEEDSSAPRGYASRSRIHGPAGPGDGGGVAVPAPPGTRGPADDRRVPATVPRFAFGSYSYTGVLKTGVGKVYSHPPYFGRRLHAVTFRVGDPIGEIFEFSTSIDDMYVAGRTAVGWVNIWCATRNNQGIFRPVYFVELTATRRLEPYEVPTEVVDYFGPRGPFREGDSDVDVVVEMMHLHPELLSQKDRTRASVTRVLEGHVA